MWLTNLKTYWRFLGNNKLYTLVTVLGFAVSLMFVLLLSIYVKQELSVDQFHEKKDRIYLLARSDNEAALPNPVADLAKNNLPEVESYTRLLYRDLERMKVADKDVNTAILLADSAFFSIFSFPLIEGDPSTVLSTRTSTVISQSFARQYFFDEDPIGKSVFFSDGEAVVITGIMKDFPQNTQFQSCDMVLNYYLLDRYYGTEEGGNIFESWGNCSFETFFLAKEGADLQAKAPLLADLFIQNNFWLYVFEHVKDVVFVPLTDCYFSGVHTGNAALKRNSKTPVMIYTTIALLILIIAILNYINLSVSQAGLRGREAAMRRLLGCNKKGLMLQFLSEAMFMTLLSFAIGLLLAFFNEPFFNDVLNTKLNLANQFLSLPFVVGVFLSISVIGLISGWVPAVVVSKFQPIDVVKGAYKLKVKSTYSKLLITFQYLVGITLLICSTFIVRQNNFVRNYDLGLSKDNILVIWNYSRVECNAALHSSFEGIAGVEKVGFSDYGTPISCGSHMTMSVDDDGKVSFYKLTLDSTAFEMYGIKIVRPAEETAEPVTVYFNQKAFDTLQPDSTNAAIRKVYDVPCVGITENFHFNSLSQEVGPIIIELKNDLSRAGVISIKIDAAADQYKTAEEIKRVYSEFNGGEPVFANFIDETVQNWYEKEEKTAKLLSAFTVLTFVILLMGIFAMSLYYVRQREKEIALRKVNGATEFEIMRMLNYNFMRWILIAFVIAVPIAYYAMTKWLESFAYKTSLSWWVFALTGVVVVALSVISISVQSWRAATANPIDSIKNN